MTRARRRIEVALSAKGWTTSEATWEPLGESVLFEGPSGGWLVEAVPLPGSLPDTKQYIVGWSVDWVVDHIERHLRDIRQATDDPQINPAR